MADISFTLFTQVGINEGQSCTFEYSHKTDYETGGVFTVYEIKKTNGKTQVRAFDNMHKFDIDVSDWFNRLSYPISLINMLSSLCSYCGVILGSISITNGSFSVRENAQLSNVTGRAVLGWIAEIAASFAHINVEGKLRLDTYIDKDLTLDNSKYIRYTKAEYRTDIIDKVQLQANENDIGVIVGTGENIYTITGNPLVYAETDSEIRPTAQTIYDKLSVIDYIPFDMTLFDDYDISAGDIITINGEKTLVMSKRMQASGVILSATGNKRRAIQSSQQNVEIIRLRGKTNELTRTIEETVSRITTAEGDISEVKQTATSLTSRITSAEGNVSTLQQTAASLTSRIATAEGNVSTLQQTATSLQSQITTANGNISTVSQTADKIHWLVASGTNSSNFTMTSRAIQLVASNINLTGYVTFNNLSTSGQTTINGGNIVAQTLTADKIVRSGSYINLSNMTFIYSVLRVGNNADNNFSQIYHNGSNGNLTINNSYGNITLQSSSGVYISGYRILTTSDLVAQ